MKRLNVLIACEESQRECLAFRALGHNAFSCDIQPCRKRSGNPAWHIWGDVQPFLNGRTNFQTMDGKKHRLKIWHLIIAHPPCTYLCKLSSVHLISHKPITENMPSSWSWSLSDNCWINTERLEKMRLARKFWFECFNAEALFVAVENPLPMARSRLPKPTFFIQPSWFGEKYNKKTLYWTKNLPPILPTIFYPQPINDYVGKSRGKYRSQTFKGIAAAIASQWSAYVLDNYETTMHKY